MTGITMIREINNNTYFTS